MERVPITKKGYKKLEQEINKLKNVDRPQIIAAISEARDHGDLKENAEYHAAREKQGYIEARINFLEDIRARVDIIDLSLITNTNVVTFGSTIKLLHIDADKERVLTIVSEYESDANSGLISVKSPIAKGLIGQKLNNVVDIVTPSGSNSYEIVEIFFDKIWMSDD